jgi:hypothetical protein
LAVRSVLVWVVLQVQSVDCSAHHTRDSILIRDTIRDNTIQIKGTTTDTTVMAIDATVIGKKGSTTAIVTDISSRPSRHSAQQTCRQR